SWTQDSPAGGGVFQSADGGRSWRIAGLAGKSVRALALAPSDPNVLVAGTMDGVYRSLDAGKSWQRISPEHDEELRNLDSLAIDPRDPRTIYAGTFHLPWKTADGGRTWNPVHEGMIDDSDVMSLLIDAGRPGRLYAGACSGIYRSDDGATQWRKIQGIPYAARRTYVIAQDPAHPEIVYAATTEGLWKTADSGSTWRRTTPESWIVNTVAIDPGRPNRVLIGTEELGVLSSDDAGETFEDSNAGFFHRQIVALAADRGHPGRILAALAHAPQPVIESEDSGQSWRALGPGLSIGNVLRLFASPDGWWASLVHGGLMRYDAQKKIWLRAGPVIAPVDPEADSSAAPGRHRSEPRKKRSAEGPSREIVHDLAFSSSAWYAASDAGLLVSPDRGATWRLQPLGALPSLPVESVRVSPDGKRLWIVSLRGLAFSGDSAKTWSWHDLPADSGGAVSLNLDPEYPNVILLTARNGLYISRDAGATWDPAGSGLPFVPVQDFAASKNLYAASMRTGGLYVSSDAGKTWSRLGGALADDFFPALATDGGGKIVFAASSTDGVYGIQK
ncbi:MAG: WD40/YVTN/BNR-like repeat-containing protein, partial [Candidatus Acidiferrales bacterium]